MQFPVAVPNDGMIDIVIQGRVSSCLFLAPLLAEISFPLFPVIFSQLSRLEMLKSFEGAEKGSAYWQDKVNMVFPDLTTNR
jgi:hypothetical protein